MARVEDREGLDDPHDEPSLRDREPILSLPSEPEASHSDKEEDEEEDKEEEEDPIISTSEMRESLQPRRSSPLYPAIGVSTPIRDE